MTASPQNPLRQRPSYPQSRCAGAEASRACGPTRGGYQGGDDFTWTREAGVTTKYDRFKDQTTIEMSNMVLSQGRYRNVRMHFYALFQGQDLSGKSPSSMWLMVVGAWAEDGGELIFLVDGARFKLPMSLHEDAVNSFDLDSKTLRALAGGRKVEGQLGGNEFALTADQIAQVAHFCRLTVPEK